MNNKLDEIFAHLRADNRKALIPFVTAGYPDPARFPAVVDAICDTGADILEIGFPHSDPLADGTVIQHSSHVAITKGFTVATGFAGIRSIAAKHSLPIIIMCYSNLILQATPSRFVKECCNSGACGLIVPDMIVEESALMRSLCASAGIAFISLITPTTPPHRARAIARLSSGFLYLVSVTGTTGARTRFDKGIGGVVRSLRKMCELPICIGFGISSASMAEEAAQYGDGVVIGSRVIQLIDGDNGNDNFPQLRAFLNEVTMRLGDGS